jgi:hypothetical protein
MHEQPEAGGALLLASAGIACKIHTPSSHSLLENRIHRRAGHTESCICSAPVPPEQRSLCGWGQINGVAGMPKRILAAREMRLLAISRRSSASRPFIHEFSKLPVEHFPSSYAGFQLRDLLHQRRRGPRGDKVLMLLQQNTVLGKECLPAESVSIGRRGV